jgi:hypothetical protein
VNVCAIWESRYRDALSLSENESIIPINFQCRIPFVIYYSSNVEFAQDRLLFQIDADFRPPFEDSSKCRSWYKIQFTIRADDPRNLAVILSHPSAKDHILRASVCFVIPLCARFTATAKLEDCSILRRIMGFGKKFQRECEQSQGLGPTKQGRNSAVVRFSLFYALGWTVPALGRRLVATDSSRIERFLLEVFVNERAMFAGLSLCHFVSIIIPRQLAPLFAGTEICHFEVNSGWLLMMPKLEFMNESKHTSERSHRSRLADKQTDIFYLCGPILCQVSIGQVAFYWRELARYILDGIVGFSR